MDRLVSEVQAGSPGCCCLRVVGPLSLLTSLRSPGKRLSADAAARKADSGPAGAAGPQSAFDSSREVIDQRG